MPLLVKQNHSDFPSMKGNWTRAEISSIYKCILSYIAKGFMVGLGVLDVFSNLKNSRFGNVISCLLFNRNAILHIKIAISTYSYSLLLRSDIFTYFLGRKKKKKATCNNYCSKSSKSMFIFSLHNLSSTFRI